MLKFLQDKNRIMVDPLTITIDSLKKIWDSDATKTKVHANLQLTYVHLVSQIDENAPYYTSSFDEVRPLVKRDLYGDYEHKFDEQEEELLESAIAEYQKAFEPVEKRVVRIFTQKIDQIRIVVEETEPVIRESTTPKGIVAFSSNFPLLEKMMSQIGPLLDRKEEMEARLRKEKSSDGVVRAGRQLSIIEQRLKKAKDSVKVENQANDEELDEEEVNEF